MLMQTEMGIFAQADAHVFRLLMDVDRTGRRLLAAQRIMERARSRASALRRVRDLRDAREHAAAAREVEREFGDAWGKSIRVRMPRCAVARAPEGSSGAGATRGTSMPSQVSKRAIRSYKAPLRDARGRTAVFFRVRYVGLRSKNWRPGICADHVLYILREEAQENCDGALAAMPILSNMGENVEEVAACWRAIEAMEEGYRANAKVQYRIIWNLPHGLDAQERYELVNKFCERTFGRLGLPWVAAIHKADARGDQRNHHAHVCFSTRPCERLGDHEWDIALEKVNGLTDEYGLKRMRGLAAGHMNVVCQSAGLEVRFTHQTYAERGIDAERQEHVGPQRMAAHERGEAVAVIERNALVLEQNELAAERDAAGREAALTTALTTLLKKRAVLEATMHSLGVTRATVAAISGRARALANSARPSALHPALRARLMAIAHKARDFSRLGTVAQAIPADVRTKVADIGHCASGLQESLGVSARHSAGNVSLRDRLSAVEQRLIGGKTRAEGDRRLTAGALLLTAPTPPYVVHDRRVVLDLSAMSAEDAKLVRTLDEDALRTALKERFHRDRELAEAQARHENERRQAAAHRERQTAETSAALGEEQLRLRQERETAGASPHERQGDTSSQKNWVAHAARALRDVREQTSKDRDRLPAKSASAKAEPPRSRDVDAEGRSLARVPYDRVGTRSASEAQMTDTAMPAETKRNGPASRHAMPRTVGAEHAERGRTMSTPAAGQSGALTGQPIQTRRIDSPPNSIESGAPIQETAWQRARHLRATAMADVAQERTDKAAVFSPGVQLPTPGMGRSDMPLPPAPQPRKWHRGMMNGGPER
jgi:hypothetical protein